MIKGRQEQKRRNYKMNFEEFTDSIVGLLKQKIGDSCTITVKEVLKNNDVRMTGIVITK